MAEEKQPVQPNTKVLAQFIRDLSFENILAQRGLDSNSAPDVKVRVNLDAKKRKIESQYEVLIKLSVDSSAKSEKANDGDNAKLFILEIEYGGIKIGGSKLLLIVPLLGTIIGGLWGGFELYSRYLDMEEKIQTYVAPDLSGFDKRLELVKTEVEMIEKEMKMVLEEITLVADVAKEMKNDLRGDIRRIEKIVEDTEARVKDDSREFRDDMKDLEERVELKINKALNNPLNKVISR